MMLEMDFVQKERIKKLVEQEKGIKVKSWGDRLSVALCFPNSYEVGMANLGFQQVYYLLNQMDDVVCERFFYSLPISSKTKGRFLSLETQRPLSDFEVIAFSLAFELDYIRMLKMLFSSSVPLRREERETERKKGFKVPFVISGGIAISANPEPLAEFLDLVVIGEAEGMIEELFISLKKAIKGGKYSLFGEEFFKIKGVYVPSCYRVEYDESGRVYSIVNMNSANVKVVKAKADSSKLPSAQRIFSDKMEFHDMGLIEIARGCGRACRFCLYGYFCRPPRSLQFIRLVKEFYRLLSEKKKLGLISGSISSYDNFEGLLEWLERNKLSFSFSSLRVDDASETVLELLSKSRNRTLTFAPESPSSNLRKSLNKQIDDGQFTRLGQLLGKYGFEKIKLYFLIGIPGEKVQDVEEISVFINRFQTAMRIGAKRKGKIAELELVINPLIPKPWTAFQWSGMEKKELLEEKFKVVKSSLKGFTRIKLSFGSIRESIFQAILSRGDRRVSGLIERVAKGELSIAEVLRDGSLLEFYLYRERGRDEVFPWDFIDVGIRKDFLWGEFMKSRNMVATEACRVGKCFECGVC